MAEATTLLSIGEFSSLARLSVRMLRHYDAHGVLVPAQVDPVTGHRRYAPAQLEDAVHVHGLRDIAARVFNVYLNSPEEVSEAELVTEVCVPLA